MEKQSIHTQNQQTAGKLIQGASDFHSGKKKGADTINIHNLVRDCQSSHNGSEASYNTQPKNKIPPITGGPQLFGGMPSYT